MVLWMLAHDEAAGEQVMRRQQKQEHCESRHFASLLELNNLRHFSVGRGAELDDEKSNCCAIFCESKGMRALPFHHFETTDLFVFPRSL